MTPSVYLARIPRRVDVPVIAEQLFEAHGPARRYAPAVAENQAVTAQLAHGVLHGVLFAVPQIALNPGELQDSQLSGMKDKDLREDRALHDLVLLSGRECGGNFCLGGDLTVTSSKTQVLRQVD